MFNQVISEGTSRWQRHPTRALGVKGAPQGGREIFSPSPTHKHRSRQTWRSLLGSWQQGTEQWPSWETFWDRCPSGCYQVRQPFSPDRKVVPGGWCPGPGDSGEQARHSPLANLLGCSRRCRPGAAAGLGLLSEEKQGPALCPQGRSQQVAGWSLCVKGSNSGAGEQEAFCICLVICWKKTPLFSVTGLFLHKQ